MLQSIQQVSMNKKTASILLPIIFILMSQTIHAEELKYWTSKSFNMANMGSTQWNWPDASKIAKFYPLGISKDGWFAHSSKLDGTEISLINLDCKDGCLSDVPAQDKCGCLPDAGPEDLQKFGVKPFANPQKGTFPAKILDDEYDIEIIYKEKSIHSIMFMPGKKNAPEFPGSYLFLVSKKMGKKKIGMINHNHMGIVPGVRPAGWIKYPLSDRLVVFILCGRDYEGLGCPSAYELIPFGAYLREP